MRAGLPTNVGKPGRFVLFSQVCLAASRLACPRLTVPPGSLATKWPPSSVR